VAASKKEQRYTEVRNPKALRDYTVEQRFEAGIALRGAEVKSIRAGRAQLADSFARIERGEAWLYGLHIEEYEHSGYVKCDPRRVRKLLLHRTELRKIAQELDTAGKALVALRLYFKDALVKVEIGLGTGKKLYDKRDDMKKREQDRDIARVMRSRR
jgi:SsrA-binding protein